jgi:heptosyltransferase-2
MPADDILLVQTGFLGDVVLSTPVISGIKSLYPNSNITVMTTPTAAPLVEHHPAVSCVVRYDKRGADRGLAGLFRLAKELRSRKFSAAFSLHKSYRTAILLALAGIKPRYGFSEASLAWLYSKTTVRADAGHDVLRNLAIFRVVGREPETFDQRMSIAFPPEMPKAILQKLSIESTEKLVGIAPGSVWATKRWTTDGFADLSRKLVDAGWQVILIGGPDDSEIGNEIGRKAQRSLLSAIGRLSLVESACLISQLKLLVSNDSSPLHMASAAGTPVAAIFCATVPEFGYGPWMTNYEILGVEGLSCRPCGRHGGQHCPTGTHACQRGLGADTVFNAAVRLLKDEAKQNGFQDSNRA